MEERLDEVAQGTLSWTDLLNEFMATSVIYWCKRLMMAPKACNRTIRPRPGYCVNCGMMQIRTASTGVFMGAPVTTYRLKSVVRRLSI